MALLIDNKYIKLELTDNKHICSYKIFKSRAARTKNKSTDISPKEVYQKYQEILTALYTDDERRYYDNANFVKEAAAWEAESAQYYADTQNGNATGDYPLMKEYIPDIEATVPALISKGQLGVYANNIKELYETVKELEIFGPKENTKKV